jgi:signal transduction histidine kinase
VPEAGERDTRVTALEPADLEWVRQRVLNVVGHELRTPTATIRGLAETLAEGVDPAVMPDVIAALQRNARRLEHLVDNLLAAADVTNSLPAEPPSVLSVGEVARAAWAEVGGTPDDLEVVGAASSWVARATSVRRILFQILDNAAKYGDRPVVVRVEAEDSSTVVEISSPGPELPAEDVRFAIEMFWRGERAVTSSWGLGLGLAVGRLLAEHEGGSLDVAAGTAGGIVTRLELPAPPVRIGTDNR